MMWQVNSVGMLILLVCIAGCSQNTPSSLPFPTFAHQFSLLFFFLSLPQSLFPFPPLFSPPVFTSSPSFLQHSSFSFLQTSSSFPFSLHLFLSIFLLIFFNLSHGIIFFKLSKYGITTLFPPSKNILIKECV